jgi:flagellar basal body-associated protein FliL
MQKKSMLWVLIGIIAVVIVAVVVVLFLTVFKKKDDIPAQAIKQAQDTLKNVTEQAGAVDMVKAFEGLSKEELQLAYDECIKHPEINKEQFDCQVILNLLKYKQ